MKRRTKFLVNTKSICFLCLQNTTKTPYHAEVINLEEDEKASLESRSFMDISRYLKFNFKRIFNKTVFQIPDAGSLTETEMMVSLCKSCCGVVAKFEQYYHELELVRLKLNASVQAIREVMWRAEKDISRVQTYGQIMMMTNNPVELFNARIAENLRKETIEKCTIQINRTLPTVTLNKVDKRIGDQQNSSLANPNHFEPFYKTPKRLASVLTVGGYNKNTNTAANNLESYIKVQNPRPLPEVQTDEFVESLVGGDRGNAEESTGEYSNVQKPQGRQRNIRKCNWCRKIFTCSYNFKQHLRTHTGEKPIQCDLCPESFRFNGNLRQHKLMKHRMAIFEHVKDPHISSEMFEAAIARLFQNVEKFSGKGRQYGCNHCGKDYVRRLDVEFHMIQVHFDILTAELQNGGDPNSQSQPFAHPPRHSHSHHLSVRTTTLSSQLAKRSRVVLLNAQQQSVKKLPSRRKYYCYHCNKDLNNYHFHRLHQLKYHRFELFSKYCPPGTTSAQLNSAIAQLLKHHFKNLGDDVVGCMYCAKQYNQLRHLHTHFLAYHFNEAIGKLQNYLQGGNSEVQDSSLEVLGDVFDENVKPDGFDDNATVANSMNFDAIKVEVVLDEGDNNMIVPDN